MEFLDRPTELKRLESLSTRPAGGLAVIWGRRRMGKTRLFLERMRREGGVYFVADQSAAPLQRRALEGPEWDVVSLSLGGELLLLGEAKWRRKQAGSQLLGQASDEMTAKGVPQGLSNPGTTLHHVLFFPLPSQDKAGTGTKMMGARDVLEGASSAPAHRAPSHIP